MKKVFAWILLTLAVLGMVGMIIWGIACVSEYLRLSSNPNTSGSEYLGLAVGIGGFVLFSPCCAICAWGCGTIAENRVIRIVAYSILAISLIVLWLSLSLALIF